MKTKLINFAKFSSIGIGGDIEVSLLDNPKDFNDNYYLIGSCNNILIGNNPPKLIKLSKKYDYIKIKNNVLIIGGATPSGKIASFCKKNDISNFEFISHLPGTLGGLVYMNAGLKDYEIFNHLINITTTKSNLKKDEINFGYRFTNIKYPILEAIFELHYGFDEKKIEQFKNMRSNQPKEASAGSCFKNPKGDYAGRLIEAVGLKGKRVGDMEFSKKHANFLINHGNGIFNDAIHLINEAKRLVKEKFKIELELEIKILNI